MRTAPLEVVVRISPTWGCVPDRYRADTALSAQGRRCSPIVRSPRSSSRKGRNSLCGLLELQDPQCTIGPPIRELTYTSEEYRAAHNATSPGMGIVGAYLGNSTAVEGGEEPSDTTRRRRTARAASGSHVGGGKERESTSSCETLHKLWTRLLNNAWGGLVSARPTMPNSTSYA